MSSSASFNADDFIPRNQRSFPLHQLAKIFTCSVAHLFDLISDGEIVVPHEDIDKARSRGMIVVTRENLVDFVRRRSSAEWLAGKAAGKSKAQSKTQGGLP